MMMLNNMVKENHTKNTKIVCTIGPSSDKKEVLDQLIENGMNVMRLNFSHGTYEYKRYVLLCSPTLSCQAHSNSLREQASRKAPDVN